MAKTYHCAVLGDPIAHSLSPVLHNAAYKALGLTNWQYSKEKVDETELPEFISHLDESWKGLSLTMPLKKTVINLGTPCDYWSRTLNVANTAVFAENPATASSSKIELYNTDVKGIVVAFTSALRERIADAKKAVIIGSGNTASSAMAALIEIAQMFKLEQVQVIARAEKTDGDGSESNVAIKGVERFTNLLNKYCEDFANSRSIEPYNQSSENSANSKSVVGIELPTISENVLKKFTDFKAEKLSECDKSLILESINSLKAVEAIAQADIVISTVPAHVADGLALALQAYLQNKNVRKLGALLDVVYDPRPSSLLSVWGKCGCAIGGEEMLLNQALEQVKLMTFEYMQNNKNSEINSEDNSQDNSDKTTDYDYLNSCMRKALQEAL